MTIIDLTPSQLDLIHHPLGTRIFLEGPAGSGKTTAGVERLRTLLNNGVSASTVLVMVPQRTLAVPYSHALYRPDSAPGGIVSILTLGGLARRMVDLFWPLVAEDAGFAHPEQPPAFLTLETAQYYMAHLVRPLLDEGYFDTITIERNRLYSQVLDNLNKAAIVGFPYSEIGERLKSAWVGEVSQQHVYDNSQVCATQFRAFCLQHNLLDFSLQVEVFMRHLWPSLLCRAYLNQNYHHLIFDNLEEDTPVAHDLLREWLPHFESALLIYDQDAGYRRFLGADPQTGLSLADRCEAHLTFTETFTCPAPLQVFSSHLGQTLERPTSPTPFTDLALLNTALAFPEHNLRFYPDMIDWVASQVAALVQQGVPPAEIVILAPFLPDSLRFSLSSRLAEFGVPHRSHRPSRSLRDESATNSLLALAQIAHPAWGMHPGKFDMAYALIQAIEGLDLVRAQLLVEITYRVRDGVPTLLPFDRIKPDVQERITFVLGNRYDTLRRWIEDYRQGEPEELDYFLSRLFGEVLSQPGYGFHASLDSGRVAANLIESIQKFRWALAVPYHGNQPEGGIAPAVDLTLGEGSLLDEPSEEDKPLGQEYLEMVADGVIAAQYIQNWDLPTEDSVLLAPAYTFLMNNRPVDYQFWLDVGSNAWFERLYQPLTQPYVLSREWPAGKVWTTADEYEVKQDGLYRLALGLARRCRQRIFLALSDLNEQGFETRGVLLKAIQYALRQAGEGDHE